MKRAGILLVALTIFFVSFSAQAQPGKTWRTGQTASYATGDDGDLERGAGWPSPRFTDNSNGTVTDNLTGLIWLKNANCLGTRTWSQALTDCNSLASGSCGLTDGSVAGDWRLPNRKELLSLVDYSRYNPALPNTAGTGKWSEGDPFSNVQSSYYWSATTNAYDSSSACIVGMYSGYAYYYNKSSSYYVWPVREDFDWSYEKIHTHTQGDGIPIILVHGNHSESQDKARWGTFEQYVNNSSNYDLFDVYILYHNTSKPIGFNGNTGNAKDLADFIDFLVASDTNYNSQTKFIFVAHSRGGLVCRSYMNYDSNGDGKLEGERVLGLITLGTPHHGSPLAVPDWLAATFWKTIVIPASVYDSMVGSGKLFDPYRLGI